MAARSPPLPAAHGRDEASEVGGAVLVGAVVMGACPSCGGMAVFRQVE